MLSIIHDPRFAQSRAKITIRCNVDALNHAATFELIDYLEQQEILSKVNFYIAPIHSWGNDAHLLSLNKKLFADFEIDVLAYLRDKKPGTTSMPKMAKKIVCMSLKKDAELIDPFGDVYNCSEISQVAAYKKVTIYKLDQLKNRRAPLLEQRPFSNWNDDILAGKVPCHDCHILPVCGGACPKSWSEGNSPCPALKENIHQRLILQMTKYTKRELLAAA